MKETEEEMIERLRNSGNSSFEPLSPNFNSCGSISMNMGEKKSIMDEVSEDRWRDAEKDLPPAEEDCPFLCSKDVILAIIKYGKHRWDDYGIDYEIGYYQHEDLIMTFGENRSEQKIIKKGWYIGWDREPHDESYDYRCITFWKPFSSPIYDPETDTVR